MDWAEDESDSEDDSSSAKSTKTVRLLDYACGTGLVSRVRIFDPKTPACVDKIV